MIPSHRKSIVVLWVRFWNGYFFSLCACYVWMLVSKRTHAVFTRHCGLSCIPAGYSSLWTTSVCIHNTWMSGSRRVMLRFIASVTSWMWHQLPVGSRVAYRSANDLGEKHVHTTKTHYLCFSFMLLLCVKNKSSASHIIYVKLSIIWQSFLFVSWYRCWYQVFV